MNIQAHVRKFEPKDSEALVELWKATFPDDPPHNDPVKVIEAKLAVDDLILVAEYGDQIVGACLVGYDGHRGWLYSFAVARESRRGGIGQLLMDESVKCLKALGCTKVNLQVRADNTEVVAFYESLGFKIEDRVSMGRLI